MSEKFDDGNFSLEVGRIAALGNVLALCESQDLEEMTVCRIALMIRESIYNIYQNVMGEEFSEKA